MFKLFSFILILAAAFAAPAPEPGIFAQVAPVAQWQNIAYGPAVNYGAFPAVPAPLTYNAPIYASYPAAPIAYTKY